MIVAFFLIIVGTLVAGFYAGTETGAYRLNRVRLRADAEAGHRLARITQRMVANMERFICMVLAAQNIALYLVTVCATALFERVLKNDLTAELASTLTMAPVLLVFVDILPKSLFQVLPNPLMRWAGSLLWITNIFLWPVVTLLQVVVAFWRRLLIGRAAPRQTVVTTQYLHSLLSAGAQEGVISPQQDAMVRNIMQLGDVPVKKVMTPLGQAQMLPADASGPQTIADIGRFNHARVPVYDGARTHIVGVLRVLDYLCDGQAGPIRPFVQPALFIHAATGMAAAFRRLQESGQPMAIVVDSQNRPVGIVTVDDLHQGILVSMGT